MYNITTFKNTFQYQRQISTMQKKNRTNLIWTQACNKWGWGGNKRGIEYKNELDTVLMKHKF